MRILPFILFLNLITIISYGQHFRTNQKETLTILTAGLPSQDAYQYSKIAPKYHFKFVWVGGCVVDDETLDSMDKHNQVVDSLLDIINEVGWRDKYEKEVKQTYARDSALIAALKRTRIIKTQLAKQKKHGNSLVFFVDSVISDNVFRIQVHGYLNDRHRRQVSYYRVLMRYSDFKICSIDDSLIVVSKLPVKVVSIPIYNKDTSYWYRYSQSIIRNADDEDLLKTNKYYHLRLWTEKQYIDVSYNFKEDGFGTVTNYATSKSTGKFYSSSDVINAMAILTLVDSLRLTEVPSAEEIQCWGKQNGDPFKRNCNDGITYAIEYATDTTYSFKTYSCPAAWDCDEAKSISLLYQRLDELLGLEERFDAFIEKLPKGCYETGLIYTRCSNNKATRKKKRN